MDSVQQYAETFNRDEEISSLRGRIAELESQAGITSSEKRLEVENAWLRRALTEIAEYIPSDIVRNGSDVSKLQLIARKALGKS